MAKKVGREKLYKQAQVLAKRLERFERLLVRIPRARDLRLDIKDLVEDLRCNPQVPFLFWPPPAPAKPRRRTRRPEGKGKGGKRV